jgi:hypothetical protein
METTLSLFLNDKIGCLLDYESFILRGNPIQVRNKVNEYGIDFLAIQTLKKNKIFYAYPKHLNPTKPPHTTN